MRVLIRNIVTLDREMQWLKIEGARAMEHFKLIGGERLQLRLLREDDSLGI